MSSIIVNNTNLPSRGTTKEVGGMISANSRKNTVSDSKIEMDRLTCNLKKNLFIDEKLLDICILFEKLVCSHEIDSFYHKTSYQ